MRAVTMAVALALSAAAGTANATTFIFKASLDGASEVPPNASPGTGLGVFAFDDVLHTLIVDVTFSGLIGTTTAAHVHAPTAVAGTGNASVATELPLFTGFPTGVQAGSYHHLFDTS